MTHLATFLPGEIELGPVQRTDWGIEVVTTDGGYEVRNARWSAPLRTFDISFPPSTRDGEVYQAVKQLYADSMGGLHSFNYRVWDDESGMTIVPVRFDSPLEIEGMAGHLDHIATFTLKEVRV
jgi:Conserved hypothetical protein 2217 (DUF2460)